MYAGKANTPLASLDANSKVTRERFVEILKAIDSGLRALPATAQVRARTARVRARLPWHACTHAHTEHCVHKSINPAAPPHGLAMKRPAWARAYVRQARTMEHLLDPSSLARPLGFVAPQRRCAGGVGLAVWS